MDTGLESVYVDVPSYPVVVEKELLPFAVLCAQASAGMSPIGVDTVELTLKLVSAPWQRLMLIEFNEPPSPCAAEANPATAARERRKDDIRIVLSSLESVHRTRCGVRFWLYFSNSGKNTQVVALRELARPARPTRSPRISRLLHVDKKLRSVSHASAQVSGCVHRFQRRHLRVHPLVRRSALAPSALKGSGEGQGSNLRWHSSTCSRDIDYGNSPRISRGFEHLTFALE